MIAARSYVGTANLFPATYASALDAAPGQPDIASARLTVCGGSAVLLIPLILGLLADAIGIEWAFGIVIPLVAGALTTVVLAQRLARTSIERSRPRDGLPA